MDELGGAHRPQSNAVRMRLRTTIEAPFAASHRMEYEVWVRLLCLSDVHGQLDALRAVLAAAERHSFHKLLVAGDLVFPGPEPLETWRRLQTSQAVMVQGVSDRALAQLDITDIVTKTDHEKLMLARMQGVRTELGDIILERIRRLPKEVRLPLENGGELLLVHGSPADPFEAMSFDMEDDELYSLLGDSPADIVVCGMSHTPFDRMVGDVRIINVGSVGDAPDGRKAGMPPKFAHATWIETSASGITVEQTVVPLSDDEP
jgi:predicted phosphodiesterase